MISLGTADYGTEVEEFDVQRKVKQTTKVMETCGTMLGIPKKTMENTPESEQLKQSRIFYQTVILNKNAWLGFVLVSFCHVPNSKISKQILCGPVTLRAGEACFTFGLLKSDFMILFRPIGGSPNV